MSEVERYLLYGIIFLISNAITYILSLKIQIRKTNKALQLLLRLELKRIYNECDKKGYSTPQDKAEFMDFYLIYHSLGKNGVMDSYKEKILKMNDCKNRYIDKRRNK